MHGLDPGLILPGELTGVAWEMTLQEESGALAPGLRHAASCSVPPSLSFSFSLLSPSSLGSQDSGIRPGPIARAPPARLSTRSSRPPETVPEGPAAGQRHTQVVRDPVPSLAGVPPAFLRGAPGAPPAQHVCVGSVANQRRARCQVPKGSRSARICEAQISGVSTARQGARATRGAAPARSGRARNDSRRPSPASRRATSFHPSGFRQNTRNRTETRGTSTLRACLAKQPFPGDAQSRGRCAPSAGSGERARGSPSPPRNLGFDFCARRRRLPGPGGPTGLFSREGSPEQVPAREAARAERDGLEGLRGTEGVALAVIRTSFFLRTTWHGPPRPRPERRRLLRGVRSPWPSSRPAHSPLPLDAPAAGAFGRPWPSLAGVVRGRRRGPVPRSAATREARPPRGASAARAGLRSRSRCAAGAGEDAGAQGRGGGGGAR